MTTETGSTNLAAARKYIVGGVETSDLSLIPITELALRPRGRRCMTTLGIGTIEALINTDAATLLKCKNFAAVSLKEVRDSLAEHGWKLKGE